MAASRPARDRTVAREVGESSNGTTSGSCRGDCRRLYLHGGVLEEEEEEDWCVVVDVGAESAVVVLLLVVEGVLEVTVPFWGMTVVGVGSSL